MEKAEVLNDFFVSVFIGTSSSHIAQDQEEKKKRRVLGE